MNTYEELIKIQKEYPNLTYQNVGYDYIKKDKLTKEELEAFERVEVLLKDEIDGFREFNNFKIRDNGDIVIRVQHNWGGNFTGVGYFHIEDFRDIVN